MVSIVINYCSNEKEFLDANLNECLKFSNDIVVSYGSHLYDFTPENIDHINYYKEKYKIINFVEYKVDKNLDLSKQKGVNMRPTAYWHNLARWTGIQSLKNKDWVFLIDSDEIPNGDDVKLWIDLNYKNLNENNCYKIATYWYFKNVTFQSKTLEDSILLIHYKYLTEDNIFGDLERDYSIYNSKTKLIREVKGINNTVLWNHFSWVRTKKGLYHKITNWAHSCDIFKNVNVSDIINYIYKDNNVNDIVHNYDYIKVNNKFNIIL